MSHGVLIKERLEGQGKADCSTTYSAASEKLHEVQEESVC